MSAPRWWRGPRAAGADVRIDLPVGTLVEPLACAVHGLRRLGPVFGDTVVLTGAGSGVIDPRPLLSEPLPLEEYGEALRRVRAGQGIRWHIRPS
jgi:hypothetical protein